MNQADIDAIKARAAALYSNAPCRPTVDAVLADVAALIDALRESEDAHATTCGERDYYIDQIERLARATGCEEDSSDTHEHVACIDAAVVVMQSKIDRDRYLAAQAFGDLAAGLERERQMRAQLATVTTGTDGVWRWMGDGHDDPESLTCPVVMSADTLRAMLSRIEKRGKQAIEALDNGDFFADAADKWKAEAKQMRSLADAERDRAAAWALYADALHKGDNERLAAAGEAISVASAAVKAIRGAGGTHG